VTQQTIIVSILFDGNCKLIISFTSQ